jgi:putative endonuclease
MAIFESARLHLFEKFIETAARRRQSEPAHLATGRRGELSAFFYLRRQGYIVVARGWRSGRLRGDLDLIAWHGDTLSFIEDKRRTLRRLARSYMRQLPGKEIAARFDILSIYLEKEKAAEFELFRGAFDWS